MQEPLANAGVPGVPGALSWFSECSSLHVMYTVFLAKQRSRI